MALQALGHLKHLRHFRQLRLFETWARKALNLADSSFTHPL